MSKSANITVHPLQTAWGVLHLTSHRILHLGSRISSIQPTTPGTAFAVVRDSSPRSLTVLPA